MFIKIINLNAKVNNNKCYILARLYHFPCFQRRNVTHSLFLITLLMDFQSNDPRSKLPSVTSLSEPARTKLTRTASVVSALAPLVHGDTIESGYYSNSPELSSVASSKSRTYSGSNHRSPGIKLKVERFQVSGFQSV